MAVEMKRPENWEHDAQLFSQDLIKFIMQSHESFTGFPAIERDSQEVAQFTQETVHVVGKSILRIWKTARNKLIKKFQYDFPRYLKDSETFDKYLIELCVLVKKTSNYVFRQVMGFSAVLLELISFLYREGIAHLLHTYPDYWFFMFKHVACDHFYTDGDWKSLETLAKTECNTYALKVCEIMQQCLSGTPRQPVDSKHLSKSSQKTTDFSETLSGITHSLLTKTMEMSISTENSDKDTESSPNPVPETSSDDKDAKPENTTEFHSSNVERPVSITTQSSQSVSQSNNTTVPNAGETRANSDKDTESPPDPATEISAEHKDVKPESTTKSHLSNVEQPASLQAPSPQSDPQSFGATDPNAMETGVNTDKDTESPPNPATETSAEHKDVKPESTTESHLSNVDPPASLPPPSPQTDPQSGGATAPATVETRKNSARRTRTTSIRRTSSPRNQRPPWRN